MVNPMDVVNGFVCSNCSDVEVAKKGIDPAHPHAVPKQAQAAKVASAAKAAEAVKAAKATREARDAKEAKGAKDASGSPELGVNRPDPPGTSSVGTTLNLFA